MTNVEKLSRKLPMFINTDIIVIDNKSVLDDTQFKILIEKYGIRYVIRNYKLSNSAIADVVSGKYSSISEEDDIDTREILEYQKHLK
jgi:acyl CoA:acetate/3-ketoacid CoA transferase alpha subunit